MLTAPEATATRSELADFLELAALASRHGFSSSTELHLLDSDDDKGGANAGMEAEIAEPEFERLADRAWEEIEFRSRAAAESYPFLIEPGPRLRFPEGPLSLGQKTYLFCLLASAIRGQQLVGLEQLEPQLAGIFQICACLGAGGFTAGSVAWFGFPRPSGDAFLPALRSVYKRFGWEYVCKQIPSGLPSSLKDGGIDVISWRDFPDRLSGKLYLLGQAASGWNWKGKSVVGYIDQLHGAWVVPPPAKHCIPAMFIPFPLHHDLDEPEAETFAEAQQNQFHYEELRFGIIFDRNRLSYCVGRYSHLPDASRQEVDGTGRIPVIGAWVEAAISTLRAGEAQ